MDLLSPFTPCRLCYRRCTFFQLPCSAHMYVSRHSSSPSLFLLLLFVPNEYDPTSAHNQDGKFPLRPYPLSLHPFSYQPGISYRVHPPYNIPPERKRQPRTPHQHHTRSIYAHGRSRRFQVTVATEQHSPPTLMVSPTPRLITPSPTRGTEPSRVSPLYHQKASPSKRRVTGPSFKKVQFDHPLQTHHLGHLGESSDRPVRIAAEAPFRGPSDTGRNGTSVVVFRHGPRFRPRTPSVQFDHPLQTHHLGHLWEASDRPVRIAE